MAHVRTYQLPHYEEAPIQVAIFKHVQNAAFLRSQLLAANPDFDYAFLDATMIYSLPTLLLATALALHSTLHTHLRTRTPHSELVWRLHPNNNIGEAYRKFGISDDSTHIIAVKLSLPSTPEVTSESVSKHLGEVVQGTSVPIGAEGMEVGACRDEGKIRKIYKLNDGGKGKKGEVNGGAKSEREDLESDILAIITLKGS